MALVRAKQTWDPEGYARNARFVSDLGAPVVELLSPVRGERLLDLGCGDGALTVQLVELGCHVTAIDSSPEMVASARERGIDAHVIDAQKLEFVAEFDAVFSNAVLHWVTEPDRVIAGVWRALSPGGRFVGEFGGRGCVARIVEALNGALGRRGIDSAALNPWYFPSAEEYRARLEERGFRVGFARLIPRPTPLPGDIGGWLETFARPFTDAIDEDEREPLLDEVREVLRPALCDAGQWTADYVRLRFAAERPTSA
ncbi:MAG: methyltransferase domain-containing protein [Myxococcota bacterium]